MLLKLVICRNNDLSNELCFKKKKKLKRKEIIHSKEEKNGLERQVVRMGLSYVQGMPGRLSVSMGSSICK